MTVQITNAEKIQRLKWNTALGAFNSVFALLTFFGSAFVLYLDELGSNNSQIGFLLSMMPFFGIVAIFIAPAAARFGYKRTFVTFFGVRKFAAAALLLTPFVIAQFGTQGALTLAMLCVMGFALCRAIAEVGFYPWSQEFIPNSIRGKHSAVNDMVSRVVSTLTIAFAGFILGLGTGLDRFMLLFAVAFGFGLLAVWSAAHLPGGAPIRTGGVSRREMLHVFRDKNFNLYLAGLGLVTLASAPLAFLPLFMLNHVGLSDSATVWLQIGTIAGGFSATYLIGWASDRYGSKPVMLSGLITRALLPIGWLLMPRNSEFSLPIALAIAFVWGISEIAWAIGSGRLLFVTVVPPEKNSTYMAVFYTAIGLIGGVSQILSGGLLDATAHLSGQWLFVPIDPFTPWFIMGIILTAVSIFLFRRVQSESEYSVSEFASLFTHGNPLTAFGSLIRYYRARDERATVVVTEKMGQTKSPLTVDELLEALHDPRFNVRFEAIISIARMNSDPRLVEALCQILDGTEISLSVIAAWALGRLGDETALPTLRAGLNSHYRSLQAHCARSLGTLGDLEVAPLLHERLQTETDKGLRIAYASALGRLRWHAALPTLFEVLETTENEGARMELALAIARSLDDEQHFIGLLRGMRQDRGTTAAQEIVAWRRRHEKTLEPELREQLDQCADLFARDQMDDGARCLSAVFGLITPPEDETARLILESCAKCLSDCGGSRPEYVVLALHALQIGC
jgi:HEAT repeat protein/MFS family permease